MSDVPTSSAPSGEDGKAKQSDLLDAYESCNKPVKFNRLPPITAFLGCKHGLSSLRCPMCNRSANGGQP